MSKDRYVKVLQELVREATDERSYRLASAAALVLSHLDERSAYEPASPYQAIPLPEGARIGEGGFAVWPDGQRVDMAALMASRGGR